MIWNADAKTQKLCFIFFFKSDTIHFVLAIDKIRLTFSVLSLQLHGKVEKNVSYKCRTMAIDVNFPFEHAVCHKYVFSSPLVIANLIGDYFDKQ